MSVLSVLYRSWGWTRWIEEIGFLYIQWYQILCKQTSLKFESLSPPRIVVTANRRRWVRISTEIMYDGRPRQRKFIRDNIKVGFRKPKSRKPRMMGNIEESVSHFLFPEHKVWLPNQRYSVTLEDKRNTQIILAEDWLQDLKNGIYQNRADIARKNNYSRAWVTKVLNSLSE